MTEHGPVRAFMRHHYRHFNAAALVDAAEAYEAHVSSGGHMLVTLAGAMSTAELGLSLAEMIRRDKVHAICCTGANLEEDIFNLVAHDHYCRIPNWRNLTPEAEKDLERRGLNRVTDTCIPEGEAFRAIEDRILAIWQEADRAGERLFPHEFMYRLLERGLTEDQYQIEPRNSWLMAAYERNLPIFVPGWEDSTLGNIFVSHVLQGDISGCHVMRGGLEYMHALANWYVRTTMGADVAELPEVEGEDDHAETVHMRAIPAERALRTIGFFQIGGGIAGDFPICVVPMIHQDLRRACPYWGYFCQISDSTTSYGSYSGAIPTEKITWGKLDVHTPMFVIESDATIVAPLVFAWVLRW
ncbi:MAG: deoxyhypusine synthase family protein [Phycisphaeraceae bacterium]|nr:deoxyhypusine synthase family protein [Phycisphaeraceae bacterium]